MNVLKVPVANYQVIVSDSISDITSIDNTIWIKGVQKPYQLISNDYDIASVAEDIYYVVYNSYGNLQFNAYADCDFKINPLYCFIKILGIVHMIECFVYQNGKLTQLSTTLIHSNGYLDTTDGTISSDKILLNEIGYSKGNKIIGSIPKKVNEIYIPKTTDQIITSGQYLDGNQTIKGDSNLVPGNITKGVPIFGVMGSRSGGGASGQQGAGIYIAFGSVTSGSGLVTIPMNLSFTPSKVMVAIETEVVYSTSVIGRGWAHTAGYNRIEVYANSSFTYYVIATASIVSFDRYNAVVQCYAATNVKSTARYASFSNLYWMAIE